MSPTSSPNSAASRFYPRRSDRTARYLDGRLPPPFRAIVTLADGWAEIPAASACLETLGNLLARFCPQVTFVLTPTQAAFINIERGLTTMRAADPFGEFEFSTIFPPHDVEIRLGGGTTKPTTQIAFSFDGWLARVSGRPSAAIPAPAPANYHAAGAELAACLAGAAAFRFWNERSTAGVNPFLLDLYNLDHATETSAAAAPTPFAPRPLDLLMVGAGSVGSANAYFLPRLGILGNVDVVDLDKVEIENLDRSPVFEAQHDGRAKATVVAEHLTSRGVSATAYPVTWDAFVQDNPALLRKHDAWLALANEHGVRRSMQSNYPPVTLQASTGRNWGIQFGRHTPFVDDCQLDRFPGEPAGPLMCADGPVKLASGKQIDAALPFSSFTAGLFVTAAVAKMAIGELQRGPNMALLSFEPTFNLMAMNRRAAATCACRKMVRPLWERIWSARAAA
jgi:hypothetical protein